ncbi:MAG: penicillin acylase family protein [Limnobaculum xujianqingii]
MRLQGTLRYCLLISSLLLTGCHSLLSIYYSDTLPRKDGQVTLAGLHEPVSVRYNKMGVPLIKGQNLDDVYLVWGYIHASERINHMVLMRLTAEGRLSEYLGESALSIDSFMRKMRFRQAADKLYQQTNAQNRHYLQAYAQGVNLWLDTHQDSLPMDLAAADYQVPAWQATDAILILSLANFGLAGNLHEEIDSLIVAQQLGTERLPWLFPVYPDEPIPHSEAKKLQGLNLQPLQQEADQLKLVSRSLESIHLHDVMASNNWAITADLTQNGGTLLANDTHLPIGLPSLWSMIQIETPEWQMAGAAIPGIPAIVLGATPNLAWGYTMVMADNQDLFLEQMRPAGKGFEYLYQGKWLPVKQTQEVFHIKGLPDVTENMYETQHGILLNESLKSRSYLLQPLEVESRYGIALSTLSPTNDDNSINALMAIPYQRQVPQAMALANQIKVISVNMLLADKQQIGWQLTGSYPLRKNGLGLFPSPGWDGKYDWQGSAPTKSYPSALKNKRSWLASANNRIVEKGYPVNFSQTWAHPERFERISTMLNATARHNLTTMKQMQYDQLDPMVAKLQAYLSNPALSVAIARLPEPEQQQAKLAQSRLMDFDGQLHANSPTAALYNLFLSAFSHQLFADEFTGHPEAWHAFVESSKSYSAQADHLLWQDDNKTNASPFWQKADPARSGKAAIVAHALAIAMQDGEQQLGSDYSRWQWGQLHRYKWNSLSSQIAAYLPEEQQKMIGRLDGYLNRGPYPAGGNINTINIASYTMGQDFNTLLIPAMRLIVDFSQPDPVWVMNNAGQSANPASPHYADNIDNWLKGEYQNLPFSQEGQQRLYSAKAVNFVPGQTSLPVSEAP